MKTFKIHDHARILLSENEMVTQTLEEGSWQRVNLDRYVSGIDPAEQCAKYAEALAKGTPGDFNYAFVTSAIERNRHNTTERAIILGVLQKSLDRTLITMASLSLTKSRRNDGLDIGYAVADVESALGWVREVAKKEVRLSERGLRRNAEGAGS